MRMVIPEHLKCINFYLKGVTILLWGLFVSILVWIFSYLYQSESHWDKFVSVTMSVFAGNIGFTFINSIYIKPWQQFEIKYFISAITVIVSGVGFFFGLQLLNLIKGDDGYLTNLIGVVCSIYYLSIFYFPQFVIKWWDRT